MRIAVPDLVSNSYFPAVATIELGFFKAQGMDVELEMIFPVGRAMEALRDGGVDFVNGPAHATPSAFPGWEGAKLLAAVSQHTFWLLVLRSDLRVRPGDAAAVKGLRIGAVPGPDAALRRLLAEAGVDPMRDSVTLAPVPGSGDAGVSFGVHAARALEEGIIDGFWGQRDGSRSGGAERDRQRGAQPATRAGAAGSEGLHLCDVGHHRPAGRRRSRRSGGSGERDRGGATGAAGRSVSGSQGGRAAVPTR